MSVAGVFVNYPDEQSMPIFANARIASGLATAVVLLSLASAYDAVQAIAVAEPVIANTAAEARRWMDDRMGRTTLPASFDRSGSCFNLSGLLAVREDRVELLFPTILGKGIGRGSSEHTGAIVLADERCLIRLQISQEVLDGGQWLAVPLRKRAEIKLPAHTEKNTFEQQLPPLGEWRVVPNRPGSGAQLTLERKGFGVWDGVSMRQVVFSENSQQSCPRGTALFAVTPAAVTIIFRDTRAELPFSVDESINQPDQNVSFVLSTPTCRFTFKVAKEILSDGTWTRLSREEPR